MRKDGWYRVVLWGSVKSFLLEFDVLEGWVDMHGEQEYTDEDFAEIDPQMVMTPNGEIVYHTAQHDPLYNTAQEQ